MSESTLALAATVGLIGDPVGRSLSAAMHTAAFAELGLPESYALWPTLPDELVARVAGLRAAGLRGANVTIPHKTAVLALLDEVDAEASAIGAVNTIVRRPDGTLLGHNTDAAGFLAGLRQAGYEPAGRTAVLLGAGGAARAVAFALLGSGLATLTVANRAPERAEELLGEMLAVIERDPSLYSLALDDPELRLAIAGADLLINATALGSDDQTLPVPADWLHPGLLVYDLIYRSTPLLRAAELAGARTLDGLEMLVQQAALAFGAWTGQEPPVATMRAAAVAARAAQAAL